MNKHNTHAITIEQAEKYARVLELRRAGATFEAIAKDVGYAGRSGAKEAFDSAIRRMGRESADDARVLENDRLDDLWRRAYTRMIQINAEDNVTFIKIYESLLRTSHRRAGLMGLDAPRQIEITGQDGGMIVTDIGQLLREKMEEVKPGSTNSVNLPNESNIDT